MKEIGFSEIAQMDETMIEKFNETRTIRIRGKNVDDIDLQKLGAFVQQANAKSSNFSLKSFIKGLKIPQLPQQESKKRS